MSTTETPHDQDRPGSEPIYLESRWPFVLTVGTYLTLMIVLRIYQPDRP
jgi:hypothetical protein